LRRNSRRYLSEADAMPKTIVTIVLTLVCTLSWAQAYKWRDANGNVQYSDTPPPAGARDVQQLRKPAAGPSSGATGGTKAYTERDAEFRKRLAEKQESDAKQAKAGEDEQVRVKNCEQSRGQLAGIDSGQRMVRLNAQGERIALDDNERVAARAEAVKAVETWCK